MCAGYAWCQVPIVLNCRPSAVACFKRTRYRFVCATPMRLRCTQVTPLMYLGLFLIHDADILYAACIFIILHESQVFGYPSDGRL